MATADEYVSAQHFARQHGSLIGSMIAEFVGLPEKDEAWVTPWGTNVTDLTAISDSGGFSGKKWTMAGWILDNSSLLQLRKENPGDVRLHDSRIFSLSHVGGPMRHVQPMEEAISHTGG